MGNAAGFLGAERVWASQGETSPSNTFPHVLAVTHNLQEPPPDTRFCWLHGGSEAAGYS